MASVSNFIVLVVVALLCSGAESFLAPKHQSSLAFSHKRHSFGNLDFTSSQTQLSQLSGVSVAPTRRGDVSNDLMRLNFVQAAFAAACAFGVFAYVASHIDEIVAKQQVATEKAQKQQASSIKSAQESQKEAIERAQQA
ncbi:unnamed protein product, partial [Heterosigma akashiwo]